MDPLTIYTIGHSNHAPEALVALLQQHGIECVVDVRSNPYSRHVPQANREALARTLQAAGISYLWMGDRLGGKPEGIVADYVQLRASPEFHEGVSTLVSHGARHRTAILCAEGDYRHCHRGLLITPALLAQDVDVVHIQPDGSLVDEAQEPRQLSLF